MIPEMNNIWHPQQTQHTWQQALCQAIRDPQQLLALLNLSHHALAQQILLNPPFRLCVPLGYVARMKKEQPNDPLLRQVLPTSAELQYDHTFSCDPVGDKQAEKIPGLLHKYQGRVLILATAACAIHCRYCFRQHYQYPSLNPLLNQELFNLIRADHSIHEIILSGGDPLLLTDNALAHFIAQLATIPQIKRLRFHSRIPIVLPERITMILLKSLTASRLPIVLVIHANHPQEFDQTVYVALQELANAGIMLLNQSVLLKGINDDAETLIALSETLFQARVMPYYLHLLDKVQGSQQFEVTLPQAQFLLEQLRQSLPGYLVPKLVKEVAGFPYKQPI